MMRGHKPRNAGGPRAREEQDTAFPLEPPRGTGSADPLTSAHKTHCGLLTPRTSRESIRVVLSHQVWGHLLEETNTGNIHSRPHLSVAPADTQTVHLPSDRFRWAQFLNPGKADRLVNFAPRLEGGWAAWLSSAAFIF